MDRIEKALAKLSEVERKKIREILERIEAGNLERLDVKKLKGRDDIFRVRKGDIRIIYQKDNEREIKILAIERRKEDTYRVLSETAGRKFGTYRTLAEAKVRLRQIEFFKHAKKQR